MMRLLTIRGVLTGLALLGLVLSPLVRPVTAMDSGAVTQGDTVGAAMDMGDMPCCPKSAPQPDCAKDCLLMAMCTATAIPNSIHATPLLLPARVGILIPRSDAKPDGFARPPPPRPPDV